MSSKTMSGARGKVYLGDSTGAAPPKLVGIYNNISWGLQYDAQTVYILGRFSGAEIAYTGQEPIGVSCTGWRIVNHGPHTDGRVPRLSDLMRSDYLTMTVVDRQTGQRIATIHSLRPTGYTTSLSERALQSVTHSYIGLLADTEDDQNVEESTASDLP